MEIQLTAESEVQLAELARRQGRAPAVVASELVALGLEQQERTAATKQEIRALLDKRWDDYRSGRSVPIDGEDVRRAMKARNQAHRERRRRAATTPPGSPRRPRRDSRIHRPTQS